MTSAAIAFQPGRILRLLTLMSFFHFCGLNNGFVYFIVSSNHHVQRTDIAPVAVAKAVSLIHFSSLKAVFFDRFTALFSGAGPVMEAASKIRSLSQSSVQSILVETELFQMWVSDSLVKAKRLGAGPAEKTAREGAGAVREWTRAAALSVTQAFSGWTQAGKNFRFWDAAGYLNLLARESWLNLLRVDSRFKGKFKSGGDLYVRAGVPAASPVRAAALRASALRWLEVRPLLRQVLAAAATDKSGDDADAGSFLKSST